MSAISACATALHVVSRSSSTFCRTRCANSFRLAVDPGASPPAVLSSDGLFRGRTSPPRAPPSSSSPSRALCSLSPGPIDIAPSVPSWVTFILVINTARKVFVGFHSFVFFVSLLSFFLLSFVSSSYDTQG